MTPGRSRSGWRAALCMLLVVVLSAMLWGAWLVGRVWDGRAQAQLVAHQTQEADLWARLLTARLDAQQRLLASVVDGLHTSLLDKPAVLDALMRQDGSMLRLFESLHVALPTGEVSHHGTVGAMTAMDVQGVDALRRTMVEGKPLITHLPELTDNLHLRVLLTVPMRNPQGHISGAVAAIVSLPVAGLMPDVYSADQEVQYLLVDAEGLVLLHSDVAQRWQNIRNVMGAHWSYWHRWAAVSTATADTQQWEGLLVTRVGLPFPQWQVVVLRNTKNDVGVDHGLPWAVWVGLVFGALLLTVGAAWLLKVWKEPRVNPTEAPTSYTADGSEASWQAWSSGAMAVLEVIPLAVLWVHEERVVLNTPQAAVMLGYLEMNNERPAMAQWLENPEILDDVRRSLMELGSFEGRVKLRKKDGDGVWVDILAWQSSPEFSSSVWHLQLPWRQRRAVPLPGKEQVWHDPLTGMPTRDAFLWGLQSWVADCIQVPTSGSDDVQSVPTQGCVLFADLDHLGVMNATTSREMGNHILRHVGRLIASYTQSLGNAARLGGDEFAVLLPGISLAHAQAVGQALCDAVWRWQPSWGGERHWIGLSVGVVAVDGLRHTPQQVLHAADMACYEAKRRGRGQVAVGQIKASPPPKSSF